MKCGLADQLGERKDQISKVKTELEVLFSSKLENIKTDKDLQDRYNTALKNADAAYTSLGGTMKSVKVAIESWIGNDLYCKKQCLDLGPRKHVEPLRAS